MTTDDPIVTMQHVRDAGLCSRGVRGWFAQHKLDFTDFLANGLRASTVEALGDEMGLRVARKAREQAQGGQP